MNRFTYVSLLASSVFVFGCGGSEGSDGAPTGDTGADVTLDASGDASPRDSSIDSTSGDSTASDSAIADTGGADSAIGSDATDAADARDAADAAETKEGGLPEGSDCTSTDECASGLACCYPCGIPDCHDKCIKPEPDGRCPLFP